MSSLRIGGAGAIVQLDVEGSDITKPVYLVAPASHIGRVVTGVVLMGEASGAKAPGADSGASAAERFGLASVAFADKLAEQGYKVVVVDAAWSKAKDADLPADAARAEEASAFLKRHHDVQRVAFLGYGVAADVAISIALVEPTAQPAFDCFVALSPEGRGAFTPDDDVKALAPTLVLVGAKTSFAKSDAFQHLQDTFAKHPSPPTSPLLFRSRVFPNQSKGFAFSGITDEDAATQAIAEVLDWLVLHLHRFRVAAGTSDTDPWWPQGRNGPFCNVGQKTWQDERNAWLTATVARPPRPPPVPSHLLFDGLSSMRRTFDLPHRMALGDVVELFVEIWEVQQ